MKYKYRLLIPSVIITSIFGSTAITLAQENDNDGYQKENVVEEQLHEFSIAESEDIEEGEITVNSDHVKAPESSDVQLEDNHSVEIQNESESIELTSDENLEVMATDENNDNHLNNDGHQKENVMEEQLHEFSIAEPENMEQEEIIINSDYVEAPESPDMQLEENNSVEIHNENESIELASDENNDSNMNKKETEKQRKEMNYKIAETKDVKIDSEEKSKVSVKEESYQEAISEREVPLLHSDNDNNKPDYEKQAEENINNKHNVAQNEQNLTAPTDKEYTSDDVLFKVKTTGSSTSLSDSIDENKSTISLTTTSNLLQDISTPEYADVQFATKIKSRNNSGLFSPVTSDNSVSAKNYLNTTLFVDRQADYNGTTYYRILNGLDGPMQGWMKSKDLSLFKHSTPVNHNRKYYINPNNRTQYLVDEPWGTSKQRNKPLNRYKSNTVFNAEKSMNLGVLTFHYGKIDSDYGWIQDKYLQDISIPLYSDAQYATKIKSRNNSGLYSPVTSNNSVSAQGFLNTTLFIDRQIDYNGTTYYRILNGLGGPMQGLMKSKDLNLFKHSTPVNHNRKYYINPNNRTQYLVDEPWGTSKQRNKQLNQYKSNTVFNAEKSINLGVLTFYYGKIGNDYGWIQNKYLTTNIPSPPNPTVVNTVHYNQSLNNVLNTQMNLNAKPQAWVNGGGWRKATRNEVRNFLDTSHQQGGAWDYTFLNLNQNQGISSSVLNQKLLSNRGILTNRGNAFTQASKRHGVNEVYLISHAVLETGHGSSQLAQGVKLNSAGNISSNGTKYYNMYGIGAVDNNALLGGARYAQRMGWDTPEKAIIGGAAFVSQNYFNRGQTTLYSMRWNPRNPGTYQYATDVNWAYATASNLKSYYDTLGIRGRYFTRHIF